MDTWAVIKTGGKQYKVSPGETIRIEKIESPKDQLVSFAVLAAKNDKGLHLGKPILEKAKVTGRVVEQVKDKKVRVVKYKPKSRYLRVTGHRQKKTLVKIEGINL